MKSCLNCSGLIRLCSLIRVNEDIFNDIYYKCMIFIVIFQYPSCNRIFGQLTLMINMMESFRIRQPYLFLHLIAAFLLCK